MAMIRSTNDLLRELPSIDSLLRTTTALSLQPLIGAKHLGALARRVTDELRHEILADSNLERSFAGGDGGFSRDSLLEEAERRLAVIHHQESIRGLSHVINATGVILHTNLGRASLSEAARRAMLEAAGYCNLEFDLTTGTRGRRGPRAEDLLANITGAEAALIVNNCASAALLVLTVLARDGETIVSRGELVEIGGDFRVPDVMAQSGTHMIEVGTTNRTRLLDYRKAISTNTRLLMRVHTSNYRIVGFTKTPMLEELVALAHDAGLLLYEDAGSGALIDFSGYGIEGEPVIRASIEAGADVVSFSGDKLLGGPQAGCVAGRAATIERMRSHPLYRALRADKLRLAALEATLEAYARGTSVNELPTHRAIACTASEIRNRANGLISRLHHGKTDEGFTLETVDGESASGGGSAPTSRLPTVLISLTHHTLTPNQIEAALRCSSPPVIARIVDDRVLFDLRTVAESEEPELERALLSLSDG
ncbi:MAG: L-seryl-tRNA(Sec) selenium transferase [Acidobacteria bacterium]|nr:MAG: L-seryl-tRNA(Sec) selenium transferase [Acidobacteriota bacterium]